jgi:RimJ/RimL family protein N-acetyltransferase
MDVTIVPIAPQHIEGYRRTLDVVARERKYIGFLEAPALDKTREFVLKNIAKRNPHFVAIGDNEVVGWCDVTRLGLEIHGHCGALGMGLLPSWRGRGNGRALIGATLAEARRCGFVRIQLTVHADNPPAIALYESTGFKAEGIMRDASLIDGIYRDEIMMAIVDRANAIPDGPTA